MTWEVRAEMLEGGEGTIRKGFPTREAAEDYPIKLALWRRVWVQKTVLPVAPKAATLRQPWTIEEPVGNSFTYLRDADGARIASLLGRAEQRDRFVDALTSAGLVLPVPERRRA